MGIHLSCKIGAARGTMGIHLSCKIGAARGTMGIHLSCQIRAVQRISQRARANARSRMGTHIHFHAKKFTNIRLKGKKSRAARTPEQNVGRTKIPVTNHSSFMRVDRFSEFAGKIALKNSSDSNTYRIAERVYFVGPKFHFLVKDWISSVLIPFYRISDKPRPFCLKKPAYNFRSCLLQNKKKKLWPDKIYPPRGTHVREINQFSGFPKLVPLYRVTLIKLKSIRVQLTLRKIAVTI